MQNNKQQNNNVNKDGYYAALTGFHRAVPIVLTAVAVFIAICFITGGTGLAGEGLVSVLRGLFSYGAFAIPVMIIVHSVFYAEDVAKKRILTRAIFSLITVIVVSAIEYTICYWGEPIEFAPGLHYAEQINGGFVGTVLAFGIVTVIGHVGLIMLSVAVVALYLAFFFANSESSFGKFTLALLSAVANFFAVIEKGIKSIFAKIKASIAEKKLRERERKSDELLDDSFFDSDNGMSDITIHGLDESSASDTDTAEQPAASQGKAYAKSKAGASSADTDTSTQKKREISLDYGQGVNGADSSDDTSGKNRRDEFGIDASADSVFTADFDPFDFDQAQKAVAKPSTKVAPQKNTGIGNVSRTVNTLPSYDEYEAQKKKEAEEQARRDRLAEFERRKNIILERQRAAEAAMAQRAAATDSAPTVTEEIKQPDTAPTSPTYESAPAQQTPASEPIATVNETNDLPAYTRPMHLSYDSEDIREIVKIVTAPTAAHAPEAKEELAEITEPEETEEVKIADPIENHPENETDEEIARRIAEKIAMKNPAYARSANDLHTSTTITTQVVADEAPATEETAPVKEEIVFDNVEETEDEADVFEFFTENVDGETKVSDHIPTEDVDTEPEFKDFDGAVEDLGLFDEKKDEDTLLLERTMLSPSPNIDDEDIFIEASEDASEAEETSEQQISSDDIVWSPDTDENEESDSSDDTEDGTVFTFDSEDSIDDEDEEDDSDEIFGEPEDEEADEDEPIEIPLEEQNPDVLKQRELFPSLFEDDNDESKSEYPISEEAPIENAEGEEVPAEEAVEEEAPAVEEPVAEDTAEDETPPFDDAVPFAPVTKKSAAKAAPKAEDKPKVKPDYSNYEFPSIELLGLDHESADENVQAEIQENADRLIDTLASFNVTASIKGVDRGPRITRYEVVPAKGVKVSSIMNLQDDIALSLAADGIRMEAPIPGKSAVGVEIPNKKSSTVRLRELLETPDFVNMKSKTAICIGKDVAGQPVINDISKMPHLLIAGATGMGKSVCINSLLISILYKAKPDEVKLIMIDPKRVEFTMYNGIPHLLIPVVSDAKQAAGALMWAVDEMERRYNLLNPLCVRNVDAYNEKVSQDPSLGEPMSKIVIVIDEFADLMLQVKDPVENLVMRIAQKARAAGIHLIIGTQRPSTNVITGTIKANIPSRISCKVASNVDSRTVLDAVGAEKLLNKGDMLFAYAGAIKPLRVQGAFVADGEVESVMAHLKQFSNGASYDEAVMEEIKKAADKCSKKGSGGGDGDEGASESSGEGYLNDRQFLDAVDIAINSGRLSTALLQRKLSIGYGKAARFIDVMCDMGIISEPNGQKPREVLITADEWHEKLSRTMIDD